VEAAGNFRRVAFMQMLNRWLLPIAFVGVGIAVFTGAILRNLPEMGELRLMVGVICILLGIHRFVASRTVKHDPRRPFGGSFHRPWDNRRD
jgi:hypothetical protein